MTTVQIFIIEILFVFFITLFLRRWEVQIPGSNIPHCHPWLSKPNMKILLIYWNILGKQLSQATSCPNHSHCFIYQNFKYFLQNQIQKQSFTVLYSRLQKNGYSWVSFLIKLQAYSLKKDSARDVSSQFA